MFKLMVLPFLKWKTFFGDQFCKIDCFFNLVSKQTRSPFFDQFFESDCFVGFYDLEEHFLY